MGSFLVPIRLESKGAVSKTSMPSASPRYCKRSRPVDCSAMPGTSPGLAPGPKRPGGAGPWPPEDARGVTENARRFKGLEFERKARVAAGRAADMARENILDGKDKKSCG